VRSVRGAVDMHHTIPRQIRAPRSGKPSEFLKPNVANHPDVVGRPGLPNRWPIPRELHRRLHPRYNLDFIEELQKIQGDATVKDVLRIRDELARKHGIERYRP